VVWCFFDLDEDPANIQLNLLQADPV